MTPSLKFKANTKNNEEGGEEITFLQYYQKRWNLPNINPN
jgi:hypothetical protein